MIDDITAAADDDLEEIIANINNDEHTDENISYKMLHRQRNHTGKHVLAYSDTENSQKFEKFKHFQTLLLTACTSIMSRG